MTREKLGNTELLTLAKSPRRKNGYRASESTIISIAVTSVLFVAYMCRN